MKRPLVLVALALAFGSTSCSSTLSQPFANLKSQPITVFRLQNWEPPQAQPGAAAVPGANLIPPQIQQWLAGAAQALPPGLIPPGLLPGSTPAPAAADAPRFYNFRIIQSVVVSDPKQQEEILDLFGKDSNFEVPRQQCPQIYAEWGFQIGQGAPPGAPPGTPPAGSAPADILVSESCDQVQMFNYGWPYGQKTGLTADAQKKVDQIIRRAFGG